MKAKVRANGREIEVKQWRGASDVVYSTLDMNHFYQESELEFPAPEKAVIEGWVARDKGGGLYFHYILPRKGVNEWHSDYNPRHLPKGSFPSITWESLPQRARIEIILISEKGE